MDYDQKKFSVMQALYPDGAGRQIVPVNRSEKKKKGLAAGVIAGIAVGIIVVLALIGGMIFFFWRKKKSQKKGSSKFSANGSSSIGGTTIEGWAEGVTSQEYFEPKTVDEEVEDQFKPELDATSTARPHYGFHHRHELSAGSVRRTSQQSGLSRASGVSPVVDHRISSHAGHISMSSFGQPSPGSPGEHGGPMSPREMSAIMSPTLGGPFSAFELHAESRPQSRPVSTERVVTMDQIRPLLIKRGSGVSVPAGSTSPGPERSRLSRFEEQTDGPDMPQSDVRVE